MPEPISDNAPNKDDVQNDPLEPTSGVPPTLDQVHQISQAQVENEDAEQPSAGDDQNETLTEDDEPPVVEDPEPEDEDVVEDEPVEEPPASVTTPPATDTPPPASQLDTDITKPGDGKIAVQDAEGKTFYFNNRDEVPADFEPVNYKALMDASTAFAKKEIADEASAKTAQAATEQAAIEADNKKRADEMQAGWETDATELTSLGFLPKDPVKNEIAKNEVYDYIESELKKFNSTGGKDGVVLTSFKQAFKAMMYDKEQVVKAAEQTKINEDKKKRGGVVQPGTGGAPPASGNNRGGKVIEAPPTGVGLDAVHNRALESL